MFIVVIRGTLTQHGKLCHSWPIAHDIVSVPASLRLVLVRINGWSSGTRAASTARSSRPWS